jgi:hypothetical protein
MTEPRTKIIIPAILAIFIFLNSLRDSVFIALISAFIFFVVGYFAMHIWDMVTDDGSGGEMDDETREQLIVTEWYSNDMNRFSKKPRTVILAEAKYGAGKFRDEE